MTDFDRNVVTIVRSHQDDPDGLAERRSLACGIRAHSGPDHDWSDPHGCLVDGCVCSGLPGSADADAIDARWDRVATAWSFLTWLRLNTDTFDPVMVRMVIDHDGTLMDDQMIDDLVATWATGR